MTRRNPRGNEGNVFYLPFRDAQFKVLQPGLMFFSPETKDFIFGEGAFSLAVKGEG